MRILSIKYIIAPILAASFLSACVTDSTEKEKKPNIIVLLTDDAGYADFGFNGCKDLHTPNIDRLAENGVVFTDAHVSATVCGPSRAGLITGRYQQRFGFECNPSAGFTGLDLEEQTLAEVLRKEGYRTAAFGKWHLGHEPRYRPNSRGFDYFWGFLSGGRHYFYNKENDREGDSHSIRENDSFTALDGYLTDRLGEKAVAFIERNKERPFFMYWAPNAVHTPMEAKQEDLELFEGHPRQALAAMTWALDRAVGNITGKLEEEGLLDNTIIFFLSDNGGAHNNLSSNLPLKGYKGNKYEGGHRVPFFMHWPAEIEKGMVYPELASSLDIFATSIAAAGARPLPGKESDGVDLLPYLKADTEGQPHDILYWRKDKMAAVRQGDYKMIRVEELGERLYDLERNPGETEDLGASEPRMLRKLNKRLERWEKQMTDPLWTEGKLWDTVTWMVHEDYFLNREPRVKNPQEYKRWESNSEKRPNIIFIMADDMGKEWVSAYGSEDVVTPNIDRLAQSGMRLDNVYAMPQCTPTRVTLLTGQYPFRHGWINHWDVPRWGGGAHFDKELNPSLGRVMKEAGYKTLTVGKWQINDYRVQPDAMTEHGFDDYCMWTGFETGNPPSAERYYDPYIHTKEGSRTYKGAYGPDLFTDYVINFLRENREEPMFIYYPMVLVHNPPNIPP
ncbi:MAG: sulfatase-like hydrolase/transferase, partial [Bacteroidota bacterium]